MVPRQKISGSKATRQERCCDFVLSLLLPVLLSFSFELTVTNLSLLVKLTLTVRMLQFLLPVIRFKLELLLELSRYGCRLIERNNEHIVLPHR